MEDLTKKSILVLTIPTGVTMIMIVSLTSLPLPTQALVPSFDKSNFHNPLNIDNGYFPLTPGTIFIYNGTGEEGEPTRNVFTVTNNTKEILGITTRVVHDEAYVESELEESTDDWFAQDDDGNVWYMGEFTTEFPDESHDGSWEAGVQEAKAGVVMLAQPEVGDKYQQEDAKGEAEDGATVLSLNEKVCVPYGCFSNVLKTEDFNRLEPEILENKFYAQDVGNIQAMQVKGGPEKESLVEIKPQK
jgi:hypothetical protein